MSKKIRVRPATYGGTWYKVDQCDNCWGALIEASLDTPAPLVRTKKYVLDFQPDSFTLCDRCVEVFRQGLPHPTVDEVLFSTDEITLPSLPLDEV